MDKHYSSRPEKAGNVVDEVLAAIAKEQPSEGYLMLLRTLYEGAGLALAELFSAYEQHRLGGVDTHTLATLRSALDRCLATFRTAQREYFEHEALVKEYAVHQSARPSGLRVSLDCMDRGQACSSCDGCDHECHRKQVQLCEWFATCVRPAAGTVAHPVLGAVPTCLQCATTHGLAFVPTVGQGVL